MIRSALLMLVAALAGAVSISSGGLHTGSDACECLNWRTTFVAGIATCGDGHEFTPLLHSGISAIRGFALEQFVQDIFCQKFFRQLNDNVCVNVANDNVPGQWYSGTWCYVSGDCASAAPTNGTGPLKVKQCTQGVDKTLRDMTLDELRAFSREQDMDIAMLVKFAYPMERYASWTYVRELGNDTFVAIAKSRGDLTAVDALRSKVQAIRDTNMTVVLDSHNHNPPFGVIKGAASYEVQHNDMHDPGHPSSVSQLVCEEGCL